MLTIHRAYLLLIITIGSMVVFSTLKAIDTKTGWLEPLKCLLFLCLALLAVYTVYYDKQKKEHSINNKQLALRYDRIGGVLLAVTVVLDVAMTVKFAGHYQSSSTAVATFTSIIAFTATIWWWMPITNHTRGKG